MRVGSAEFTIRKMTALLTQRVFTRHICMCALHVNLMSVKSRDVTVKEVQPQQAVFRMSKPWLYTPVRWTNSQWCTDMVPATLSFSTAKRERKSK